MASSYCLVDNFTHSDHKLFFGGWGEGLQTCSDHVDVFSSHMCRLNSLEGGGAYCAISYLFFSYELQSVQFLFPASDETCEAGTSQILSVCQLNVLIDN